MKVRWTRPALRHLEEIGDYVAHDNPAAADRLVNRILDQVELLEDQPSIGRAGRLVGTRELVVTDTPFIVPYRVRDGQIEVLAVFHGARRWPDRLE